MGISSLVKPIALLVAGRCGDFGWSISVPVLTGLELDT